MPAEFDVTCGVAEIMVITLGDRLEHLDALIAEISARDVVLIADDLIAPQAALAPVLDDEFAGNVVLVARTADGADVRIRHHQVVAVGSNFHRIEVANQRLVGALRLSANSDAADALRDLRSAIDEGIVPPQDLFRLIVVALVRHGVRLRAVSIVDVPWFRNPQDRERAMASVEAVSPERIARLQANRVDDGFYSTFVVRKVAKPFTRVALRLGLKPNAITLISFIVGIGAAASFAGGALAWLILGALLLQLSLVLDCVDGEVARATRTFTPLGAWLDALTDRVKELLVYAGLAFGAVQQDAWLIAIALVVMQTTRHMMDYDFSAVQRQREGVLPVRDVRDPADLPGDWTTALANTSSPAVHWVKKVLYLPIGERWLLISLIAILAGPWWALMILLTAGAVAFAYVLLGRVIRTRTWRGPSQEEATTLLMRQSDALLLRPPIAWFAAPWGWTLPVLLRLVELVIVAAVVWRFPELWVLGFAWLAVVAFHDYDLLYRALHGASMPRWITILGLGWDGRTAVIIGALIIGALASVLGFGVAWFALVLVVVASVQWLVTR